MSRCLICDRDPDALGVSEMSNDALLLHMQQTHGYVDLTEPVALKRSRRARTIALIGLISAVALAGAVVAVYLGLLVRTFDFIAG